MTSDARNYVIRYAQRLHITERDCWLIELALRLGGWSLVLKGFVPLSSSSQSDEVKFINHRLRRNGIAFDFELAGTPEDENDALSSDDMMINHALAGTPEQLHRCIRKLLIAIERAKSDREVFIIHLVALWELRRSELDLPFSKDTPYFRPEWENAGTQILWPRSSALYGNAELCREEKEAWNSDLKQLGSIGSDYLTLGASIDKLSVDHLNRSFRVSVSASTNQLITILVISADPTDASRLRIGKERREVGQALRSTKLRDRYTWKDAPSCRIRDIAQALDEHKPNILLFTGHGNCRGICFEDEYGNAAIVPTDKLAKFLEDQKGLDLVIMNACYSAAQAQAVADAVGYVVGLEGVANDQDAIDFSREFFTALGDDRTFEEAFNRAKKAIALNQNCTLNPQFLKRP